MPSKRADNMTVRDFGKSNFTKFRSLLSQASWPDVSVDDDPNNCYDVFLCEFSRLYNVSFPQRTRTKSVHSCKMPWITKSLLISIRKKLSFIKNVLLSPSADHVLRYKRYRNKLNHLLKVAKQSYYNRKFGKAKNNLRLTWKLILMR